MCMGLGCNAVGVTGCRIIDSGRERLIAALTNSFMPCNGRFPTVIAVVTVFFSGLAGASSVAVALALFALILLGVAVTLLCSAALSATILRGEPSAFALELPPYRRPEICKTVARSILDRTFFVLGRSLAVAAPAGLIIWILANATVGGETLLSVVAEALDPLGKILSMDGAIILAFLLSLPASEIFIPITLMIYSSGGSLADYSSIGELSLLLTSNGWTAVTAIAVCLFTVFHFPCAGTLLTVKRETGRWKWAALAAVIPTAVGVILCLGVTLISKIIF